MIVRTSEQILKTALDRLVRETSVVATSPGTVARTLFEIISEEMSFNYRIMDANISQMFLSTAGGESLEYLGQLFGITRTSTPSTIDANEGRLYFYLNSSANHVPGTSDIDNTTGAAITIPSGTQISTEEIGNNANPVTWVTTADCTIGIGNHMTFASVKPVAAIINTVGIGTIKYHNLDATAYPDIFVYNKEDLEANPSQESDTNLRYRIKNAVNLAARGNELAIRLAALSVTGIRDCSVTPLANGVGTVGVTVVLEDPTGVGASTIFNNAIAAVQDVVSAGDIVTIARPTETEVGITGVLVGNAITDKIRLTAKNSIIRYLSSLNVGDPIIPARIINEAISISPEVTDFAIMDGGFRIGGEATVFTKTHAASDEQFYPDTADIVIL